MINRYSTPEMKKIWSDKNKFDTWLKVEILAIKAFVKLGKIPREDYEKIKRNAKFSLKRIAEIEASTKHDVIAFTRTVSETLGPEKKWVHYGLTSSDVVDTSSCYMIHQANKLIQSELYDFINLLKAMSIKYKNLKCIGRTHGMHAEITTYGYKFALWYDIMTRNFRRLINARNEIEVGIMSGAVGNYANIDPFVQEYVCSNLDINSSKISTQVLQRDRHANYISTLAIIASSLETIATEIRNLQRSEVAELEEGFTKGQKGSSAMPHKRNPISSENITGIARVIRGYATTALQNVTLWHERDISHSSAERIIIPDATTLIHYSLRRLKNVVTHLKFKEENIQRNLNLSHGLIYSQRVLLHLIDKKGWSREKAYDIVQPIAMEAYLNKKEFKNLVVHSKILNFDHEDIKDCFSDDVYTENMDIVYKRLGIE